VVKPVQEISLLKAKYNMVHIKLFQPFIIAILLGALMGLERAFATRIDDSDVDILGGIRTFSLISLFGCIAAFLNENYQSGILFVSFIGVLVLAGISYFISFSKHNERGITTEISLLICFTIGVMVQLSHYITATFIAIFVTFILYLKEPMRKLIKRVESEDIRAVLQFAIITFVVLPILDPEYAYYLRDVGGLGWLSDAPGLIDVEVINPHTVWLMVVLISGIGFTGYLAIKILGSRKGIGLTGFLGGLVSSTATTMTFSKRSRDEVALSLPFSLGILLACTTMFPRILVEVLIVNSSLLPSLSVTMGCMAASGLAVCFFIWKKTEGATSDEVPLKNPFNIMPAVKFGLLYAIIVFVARVMEVVAGDSGIYIVSVLSGLTDVDAITLTMSQISRQDSSKLTQATVAITLAAFSNTILKAGMAYVLGSRELRRIILVGFAIILIAGFAGLFLISF
jgi:uncharacterized membrane protein (DUF4010 family)